MINEILKYGDRKSQFIVLFSVLSICILSTASRIRGKVAQVPFDEFHRYSTTIIKKAVFGVDDKGNIKRKLRFQANHLVSRSPFLVQIDIIVESLEVHR